MKYEMKKREKLEFKVWRTFCVFCGES